MSLDKTLFNPGGSPAGPGPTVNTYGDGTETLATMLADAYFDTLAYALVTGDLLWLRGSDGNMLCEITSSSGDVSLTHAGGNGSVVEAATGSTFAAYGVVEISASATGKTYSIGAPIPGVDVLIVCNGAGTKDKFVIPSDTSILFDFTGNRKLTLDAVDEAILLRGITSTQFAVVANTGSVTVGAS